MSLVKPPDGGSIRGRLASCRRSSSVTGAGRSSRRARYSSRRVVTIADSAAAAAADRRGRRTRGSCQSICFAARAIRAFSVASRIAAEPLASNVRTAALPAVAAISSLNASVRSGRRAMAVAVSGDGGVRSNVSRSSSVSTGDSRITGSQTLTSVSAASRRIRSRGTPGMSFSTSAIAARTRMHSSATSLNSIVRTCRRSSV